MARLMRLLKKPLCGARAKARAGFQPRNKTREIIAALAARLPPESRTDVFSTL